MIEYPQAAPRQEVTVLAVSPFPQDHFELAEIFRHTNWRLYSADSWAAARCVLENHPITVILCEDRLPDGTWRNLLDNRSGTEVGAPAPVIVTSRNADDLLWSEVLNLGGYDVVAKPFDRAEITRSISQAWRFWKGNFERRMRSPMQAHCNAAG